MGSVLRDLETLVDDAGLTCLSRPGEPVIVPNEPLNGSLGYGLGRLPAFRLLDKINLLLIQLEQILIFHEQSFLSIQTSLERRIQQTPILPCEVNSLKQRFHFIKPAC